MRRGKRNRRKTAFTVHSSKYSHGWLHLWSNCGQMTASQYRVLSKIVERRGGREKENIKKETEGRREKKKKKLSLLQVRLRIWWKREPPRIETFGVQWRIENCPRDEWNREIRSAFSKMRRKYRVSALSCPSYFLLPFLRRCVVSISAPPRDNAEPWNDHDDSPSLQIHFRFAIAIEFSPLLRSTFLEHFLSGDWGKVFIRRWALGVSSHSVFTRRLVFLIFPYSWREAPFHRYSESHHVPVECPARSLLGFPACYERDWNFFQRNRFLYYTIIYLDTKENFLE